MVNTKKLKLLLFLSFVILFPFGQLLRYQMNLAGIGIVFHPIDFLVGICGIMVLVSGNKFPPLFRHLTNFYLAAFFYIIIKLFKEFIMEVTANINLRIDDLASVIANLSKEELRILEARLSKEDKILKKRLNDVKNKKVKLLSREQVFSNL